MQIAIRSTCEQISEYGDGNMNKNDLTLVVGGNGKTGRRVAERLQHLGLPFRIGSRSGHPPFDWEDRETWLPSLNGVTQAYVTYYPDLCVPGALEALRSFFAQAVNVGVNKMVFLSGRGEVEAEQAERALKDSGADWTILRCSFFTQNFSENFWLDPIIAGEVALPVRSVAEPFVDVEDIADAAGAALTQPGHSRQLYELTGPRALTLADAIGKSPGQRAGTSDTFPLRRTNIVMPWFRRRCRTQSSNLCCTSLTLCSTDAIHQ